MSEKCVGNGSGQKDTAVGVLLHAWVRTKGQTRRSRMCGGREMNSQLSISGSRVFLMGLCVLDGIVLYPFSSM